MVPFNHLKTRERTTGMAYWLNSGFEAVAETGGTGTAAFKAEGAAGLTKSMAQTVYPSNRQSYTPFSCHRFGKSGKRSDNSQVGVGSRKSNMKTGRLRQDLLTFTKGGCGDGIF